MKLYGAVASPYVTRVLMLARLKGIDIELTDAPGGPRSAEYLAMNPIAKIPCLEAEGKYIPESETICEYLEDIYPEPSGLPADAMGRAISRTISRMTDLYIAPHAGRMVRQINPEKRDQAVVDEVRAEFEKSFGFFEHFMGAGPFAVADVPTLGDCAFAPYMMLVKKIVFDNFAEIPDPTQTPGRLADWWRAIQDHEVCAATVDEYGAAVDGFLKFLVNRTS